MDLSTLGITKDDVLNLAAQRLVEAYAPEHDVAEMVDAEIKRRVREHVEKRLERAIDATLNAAMEKILGDEIIPCTIWGERTGKPTTIRAALADKARDFWDVRVERDGRITTYGGKPRHEYLMEQILKDKFAEAVKENATTIIAAFKAAVTADAQKMVAEHINKLIVVR